VDKSAISMSEGDPGASEADISVYEPANASPMKHLSVTEKNPGMAQFAISAKVAVLVYLLSLVTLGRFQVVHADKTHGGDHGHDTSY